MNLTALKTNPNNPRICKDDKFFKLVNSIREFPKMMELRPIVVDEQMIIQGGNMRFKAIKELGLKEIPDSWVKQANDLTEDEKKRFIISDNVGFGEWDNEMLANEWDSVELEAWGLDLPNFEVDEVLEAKEDDFDVPEGGIETDIVLGDLFEIGEHRLLCGDSTDSDSVAKLMNGEKAEISFTSPPYNIEKGFNCNEKNKGKKYEVSNDNKDDFDVFLSDILNNLLLFSDYAFINMGIYTGNKEPLFKFLFENIKRLKEFIYWVKSTGMPMAFHEGQINNRVEQIYIFSNKDTKIIDTAQYSKGTYFNVIEGNNASSNEFSKIHKATFPLYLPENIINNFSNKNAIVLDCFGGTGTTMVAAHQLNRKAYLQELDPKYCQVIIDRMKKLDPTLIVKKNGVITNEFQ